jgi:hypothetical protein
MPYGGEIADHHYVQHLGKEPYLFARHPGRFQLVYAGAMLPKAYEPLEQLFSAIREHPTDFQDVEFHFIGTGKRPNDPQSHNIKPLAEQYGLWEKTVFEYPARIPYLDVLVHLNAADGIFILGSTEPHYTPSKVFQAVLSQKPVLAVLHQDSTALRVIRETGAGIALPLDPSMLHNVSAEFPEAFRAYRAFAGQFNPSSVKLEQFNTWTAREVTRQLAALLDKVTA